MPRERDVEGWQTRSAIGNGAVGRAVFRRAGMLRRHHSADLVGKFWRVICLGWGDADAKRRRADGQRAMLCRRRLQPPARTARFFVSAGGGMVNPRLTEACIGCTGAGSGGIAVTTVSGVDPGCF